LAGRKPDARGCIGGGVGIGIRVSGLDSGGIVASRRDSGKLRGIVASRHDSDIFGGKIVASGHDSGGFEREKVASGRDSVGLGEKVASRRDSVGLGREKVVSERDSGGLREAMTSPGPIRAFGGPLARLLDSTLGSNGCKAFLLEDLALEARHKAHVAKTLLAGFEASERKQESRRFCAYDEQYLEDIMRTVRVETRVFWLNRDTSLAQEVHRP
jgi:hypothetical protein